MFLFGRTSMDAPMTHHPSFLPAHRRVAFYGALRTVLMMLIGVLLGTLGSVLLMKALWGLFSTNPLL